MNFQTASISNPGGRAVNEDHCGHVQHGQAGCWVVADGLGGHGGGQTAARIAVDEVLRSFRANPAVTAEAMTAHIDAAQAAVLESQGDPSLARMRTTLAVLLANANEAICAHCGDSRIYQFRAGELDFQTLDHSVPGALAASGAIPYHQIRFHEDRNRLLRSLGNEGPANPVVVQRPLVPGDAFLMCSDGFWEYVSEIEMEVDWSKARAPGDWVRLMTSRLLGRAKLDHDNYTCMAIDFASAQGTPLPANGRRRSTQSSARASWLEKLSWIAIACFTATLLVFLAVVLFPDRVLPKLKRLAVTGIATKSPSEVRNGVPPK